MLACTFVHKKFSHRAPQGDSLLRCFISSSRVPELLTYSDDQLQSMAMAELKDLLGLTAMPKFARVFRWDCALPQYQTGHLDRVANMESILAKIPGMHFVGNSFHGIGIPDCIRSGRKAAEQIISSS
jgi:oxygen-dependent protoporphyrinogen oxidase